MTEDDVRRIIREELAAANKTAEQSFHEKYGLPPNDQRAESFPSPVCPPCYGWPYSVPYMMPMPVTPRWYS